MMQRWLKEAGVKVWKLGGLNSRRVDGRAALQLPRAGYSDRLLFAFNSACWDEGFWRQNADGLTMMSGGGKERGEEGGGGGRSDAD